MKLILLLLTRIRFARPVTAINEGTLLAHVAAFNESIASGQEWVRLAPYGEWPNEIGMQIVDRQSAEEMASAFNSLTTRLAHGFRGLPIYVGHPDEPEWARRHPESRMEAVGRIKAMEVRDDGPWVKVAFNERGRYLLEGEAPVFAFQSPRWGMKEIAHARRGKAFRPVVLYSIGLTNQPQIPDNTIGLNEQTAAHEIAMKQTLIKILAALGKTVAADATDEQLCAAANEAVPMASAAVAAQAELAQVKPQLTTAQNETATLRGQLTAQTTAATNERTARADAVLTLAINSGRITEAQRAEWRNRLVTPGADFAAVETELGKLKPSVNTQALEMGGRRQESAASADRIAAINTAVAKHQKDTGLGYHDAYCAVKAAQPALFSNTGA